MSAFLIPSPISSNVSHRPHSFFAQKQTLVKRNPVSFAARLFPRATQTPGATPVQDDTNANPPQLAVTPLNNSSLSHTSPSPPVWAIVIETSLQIIIIVVAVTVSVQARKKALSLVLASLSIPTVLISANRIVRLKSATADPQLQSSGTTASDDEDPDDESGVDNEAEIVKSAVDVEVKDEALALKQNELLASRMTSALAEEIDSLRYMIDQYQKAALQREVERNTSIAEAIAALNTDIRSLRRSIDTRNQADATAPFAIVSELELVKSRLKETETFKSELEMQLKATEVNYDEAKRGREKARRDAEEAARREFALKAELTSMASQLEMLDDVTERLDRAQRRNDELQEQVLSSTAQQVSLQRNVDEAERRASRVENISKVLRDKVGELTGKGAEMLDKAGLMEMGQSEEDAKYWREKLQRRGNMGADSVVFDELLGGKKRVTKIWPSDPLGTGAGRADKPGLQTRLEGLPVDGGFAGDQEPAIPAGGRVRSDKLIASETGGERIFSFSRGEFDQKEETSGSSSTLVEEEKTDEGTEARSEKEKSDVEDAVVEEDEPVVSESKLSTEDTISGIEEKEASTTVAVKDKKEMIETQVERSESAKSEEEATDDEKTTDIDSSEAYSGDDGRIDNSESEEGVQSTVAESEAAVKVQARQGVSDNGQAQARNASNSGAAGYLNSLSRQNINQPTSVNEDAKSSDLIEGKVVQEVAVVEDEAKEAPAETKEAGAEKEAMEVEKIAAEDTTEVGGDVEVELKAKDNEYTASISEVSSDDSDSSEELPPETVDELILSASELVKKARTRGLPVRQVDHLFQKAASKLETALARENTALIKREYGSCLLAWAKCNIGDGKAVARLTRSLEFLSSSLEIDGQDETTLFNTGLCLCLLASAFDQEKAQEYYKKAAEMYENVLAIDPKSRIGCFNCGLTYVSLGRLAVSNDLDDKFSRGYFEKAMERFEQALQLKPEDVKTQTYLNDCKQQLAELSD